MTFPLLDAVLIFLRGLQYLIFASVIASWISADPNSRVMRFLNGATEPLYAPVRPLTQRVPGPIDLAPMVVLLLLEVAKLGVTAMMRSA